MWQVISTIRNCVKLHGRLHWIYFYLFLDKIITGNNENNGSYFVETLYNSRCTAYNGTALDNRGQTVSCAGTSPAVINIDMASDGNTSKKNN